MKSRLSATALVLAMALPQAGCGTLATLDAALKRPEDPQPMDRVIVTSAPRHELLGHWVSEFALMALFAKVAYRKDLPEAGQERLKRGCEYLGQPGPATTFGMPHGEDGAWKRLNDPAIDSCYNGHGLYYETYVFRPARRDRPGKAVIAIRGTENWNLGDALKDWGTNFAAALGIEPPEYRLARDKLLGVIEALKYRYEIGEIYVTGHSLGGGIAQQMAYASAFVRAAYAFNPSPVTNWSILVLQDADKQHDPAIYRIYHRNEALAHVRNVTTRFNTRRFGRSDYEFYFQQEKVVKAHEMGILACHLAARMRPEGAAHHFPKSFAEEILAPGYLQPDGGDHPICSDEIDNLPGYDSAKIAGRK